MYRSLEEIPPRVARAQQRARELGFTRSCTDEVGRLLRVLAGTARGTVAELGAGCGVGTSWLASGLAPGSALVSVELDEACWRAARAAVEGVEGVEVVHGDWRSVLDRGPFGLLFPDCAGTKELTPQLAACVAPGGLVVVDDLTPAGQPLPPERVGTELLVSPAAAALVLTKVR